MKTLIIKCHKCGEKIVINGLGRKPLDIPLKNILEVLRKHHRVDTAAQELNCSEGYIYNAIKSEGLKLSDIINDSSEKDQS